MGTRLGDDRGPITPTLKLDTIGQTIRGHVIDIDEIPAKEFGTGEPKLRRDGTPKMQDRLMVLVTGGHGLITAIGPDGDPVVGADGKATYRPVVEGDIGAVYIEGPARWDPDLDAERTADQPKSFSGARKDAGGLEVGDAVLWVYEGDRPGKAAQPRKLRLWRIRRPRPDEMGVADRCETLRRERRAVQLQPAGAPARPAYDAEPF